MSKQILFFLMAILFLTGGMHAEAEELTPTFTLPAGGDGAYLKDGSHSTSYTFKEGDTITVRSTDASPIAGIYIIWDSPVNEWLLHTEEGDLSCGGDGFLHEYIALSVPTASAMITIPAADTRISDIRIFSQEGPLPDDVQVWNPPCEEADILLVPAHADDEILFFGGILPTYGVVAGADIQVVYMAEFWSSNRVREHEKLDGLWEAGLHTYPVCGNFKDVYSETIERAQEQYNFEDMVNYLTEQIRRFRPQVIVTHDQNGEYGHGFHMLTSKAVTTAVEAALDGNQYTESASAYGTWDTPKTYLHLYGENKIRLDLRQPIDAMNGRTALEVAADAYKKHVSQQWCWFYVSDDYQYSCAEFGLYRTTVGNDTTGDDLLENLKTYKVRQQEEEQRKAEELEAARRREEELEQQRRQEAEQQLQREKEQQLALQQQQELEAEQQQMALLSRQREEAAAQRSRLLTTLLVVLLLLAALFTTVIILHLNRRKHRRKKRK